MNCPHCTRSTLIKFGTKLLKDGTGRQTYLCKNCNKRCNERTGSPMARLRTPTSTVSLALKMRTEGMGIRAAGRVLDKSHATIINWERRVAAKKSAWTPPAPANGEITVEGDEVYTRVGENLPPRYF